MRDVDNITLSCRKAVDVVRKPALADVTLSDELAVLQGKEIAGHFDEIQVHSINGSLHLTLEGAPYVVSVSSPASELNLTIEGVPDASKTKSYNGSFVDEIEGVHHEIVVASYDGELVQTISGVFTGPLTKSYSGQLSEDEKPWDVETECHDILLWEEDVDPQPEVVPYCVDTVIPPSGFISPDSNTAVFSPGSPQFVTIANGEVLFGGHLFLEAPDEIPTLFDP